MNGLLSFYCIFFFFLFTTPIAGFYWSMNNFGFSLCFSGLILTGRPGERSNESVKAGSFYTKSSLLGLLLSSRHSYSSWVFPYARSGPFFFFFFFFLAKSLILHISNFHSQVQNKFKRGRISCPTNPPFSRQPSISVTYFLIPSPQTLNRAARIV